MSDFRDRAACRGLDVNLFFPLGRPGSPGFERQARPARAVCADCRAREACLADALAHGDDVSIRGGLDPAQRRMVKRFRLGRNRRPAGDPARRSA